MNFKRIKSEQKNDIYIYSSDLKKVNKKVIFSLTKPFKTAILFYVLKQKKIFRNT